MRKYGSFSRILCFVACWQLAVCKYLEWHGLRVCRRRSVPLPRSKDSNDFLPMEGRVLHQPLDQQMFENVRFVNRENGLGVQLAHFLVRDQYGRRQLACRAQSRPGLYDRVDLSFAGVGVSDNGEIPKMTVDALCFSEDELSSLSPIWIPMADIYQSEPMSQKAAVPRHRRDFHPSGTSRIPLAGEVVARACAALPFAFRSSQPAARAQSAGPFSGCSYF